MNLTGLVKGGFTGRPLPDLLDSPISALQGTTAAQETILGELGIATIFDLAFAAAFDASRELVESAANPRSVFARHGRLPAGQLDRGRPARPVADLASSPLGDLAELNAAQARAITDAFGITTVGDLAHWPPYLAARQLVQQAYDGSDPGLPDEASELVPRFGAYATETAYYTQLVMIDGAQGTTIPLSAPVDVTRTPTASIGPAIGALLSYKQTWTPQTITLGKVLHSVSLAPGETTKIAVIDFTRRARTTSDESISQSEALSNAVSQTSSVNQVAKSVAREMVRGRSRADANSEASLDVAHPKVALIASAVGIFTGDPAVTLAGVSSGTTAVSTASSRGRRSVTATFGEQISSATEQASMAERTRKAALVTEASQEEREQLTTRAVTNYNHMHALNVLYFEVVEVYQVLLRLETAERVLYVPMKPLAFDEDVIARFRQELLAAALTPQVQSMLINASGATAVVMQVPRSFELDDIRAIDNPDEQLEKEEKVRRAKARQREKVQVAISFSEARRAGGITGRTAPRFDAWEMNAESMLVSVGWDGRRITSVELLLETGTSTTLRSNGGLTRPSQLHPDLPAPVSVADLNSVVLHFSKPTGPVRQTLRLHFARPGGVAFTVNCDCVLPRSGTEATLVSLTTESVMSLLQQHLDDNALYYSQAIWRLLDPQFYGTLLAQFSFNGQPLIDFIDPSPVAVTGAFAVFRFPDDDDRTWIDWQQNKLDRSYADARTIALPTGGVFAEAVLGRSNSAEKLDVTRFFNWQDSPIPILAPDIAAIQAGQRAIATPGTPGSLDAPIVNLLNVPPLPIGGGLASVLGAVSQPNLFRDMSGLAGTQQLAQAGLQTTGQSLNTAISAGVDALRLAAGLATSLPLGAVSGASANPVGAGIERRLSPGTENITNTGGLLNLARGLDQQTGSPGAAATGNQQAVLRSALPGSQTSQTSQTTPGANAQPSNFLRIEESLPPELQGTTPAVQAAETRLSEMKAAGLPDDLFQQDGARLLKGLYTRTVKPLLMAAQGDRTKVDAAYRTFLDLEALSQKFELTGLAAELNEGRGLLQNAIKNAIEAENADLAADADIRHVQRIDVLLTGANLAGFINIFDMSTLNASVTVTLSGLPPVIEEGEVVTAQVSATRRLGGGAQVPLAGGRVIVTAADGAPGQLIGTLDGDGRFGGQFSLSSGPLIGTGRAGSTGITFFAAVASPETALLSGEATPVEVPGRVTVRFLGGRDPAQPGSPLQPSPFTLTNGQQCLAEVEVKQGSALLADALVVYRLTGDGSITPASQGTIGGRATVLYTAPASGTDQVAFVAAIVGSGSPLEAAARYDVQIL